MAAGLTERRRKILEKALHDRMAELRGAVRRELEASDNEQYVRLLDGVHDEGDESVADLLSHLNLAVLDRHLVEVREVEAALARLQAGSYGVCGECGEEIDYRRLRATPTAVRCHDCQARWEREHAGYQSGKL